MARIGQRCGKSTRRRWHVVGIAAAAGGALSLGCAAFAETYGAYPYAQVGTNGSDAGSNGYPTNLVAISHGGCAHGAVAIAIGESNRHCGGYESPGWWGDGEANGNIVAIGLLGAEAAGSVAVADSGDARTCDHRSYINSGSVCLPEMPPLAVSATGSVYGVTAISGTGNASTWGQGTAISGTGTATGYCESTHGMAVSVTGDASGCIAVSGTGNASGTTAVSVLGTVEELLP